MSSGSRKIPLESSISIGKSTDPMTLVTLRRSEPISILRESGSKFVGRWDELAWSQIATIGDYLVELVTAICHSEPGDFQPIKIMNFPANEAFADIEIRVDSTANISEQRLREAQVAITYFIIQISRKKDRHTKALLPNEPALSNEADHQILDKLVYSCLSKNGGKRIISPIRLISANDEFELSGAFTAKPTPSLTQARERTIQGKIDVISFSKRFVIVTLNNNSSEKIHIDVEKFLIPLQNAQRSQETHGLTILDKGDAKGKVTPTLVNIGDSIPDQSALI